MKKLLLFFLSFSLLFSLTIERPWDYNYWAQKNSNIIALFGHEIWNTNQMHQSLEALELEELTEVNEAELEKAEINYENAKNSKLDCEYIGEKAFNADMILNPEIIIFELTYKQLSESTISECLSYPTYWRNTMNHALNSMEGLYAGIEEKCGEANDVYYEMSYSGLCDYSEEDCEGLGGVVKNCNGEYYFGEFSKVYEAKESINEITEQVKEEIPMLLNYSEVILIVASELPESISTKVAEGEESINSKEQYLVLLKNEVSELENKASTKSSELEKHNLEKITSGSIIEYYIEEEITDIPLEFEGIKNEIEDADGLVQNADVYYTMKSKDYLKNSIESLEEAKGKYVNSYEELEAVEEEAEQIVEAKKEEAQNKLNLFKNEVESIILDSETELLMQYAEENYQKGENSNKYGDRYFFYRETVKYLNLAELSLGSASGKEELTFTSELSNLETLVKNAEKDELEVGYEKQMIDYLEEHPSTLMMEVIEELSEGIIEKAEFRYGYLEEESKEIRELINISQEDFGYFNTALEKKEREVFLSSKIDYRKAIGKLKELEELYTEIKGEILLEVNNVLPSRVESKESVVLGKCTIGENCEVKIEIQISNPYKFLFENPKVIVTLPFESMLYKNNIEVGKEYVNEITVEKKELCLYFQEIRPLQTYYLLFLKNMTLIEIETTEVYSDGNPDGTAYLEYTYSINSLYDVRDPTAPEVNGKITGIKMDGAKINYRKEILEKTVKEGEHELEISTFYEDAFETEKTGTYVTEIGLKKKVSYNFEITPKIDLSKILLILDEGLNEEVEDISVTSYSGHQIKNKNEIGNGEYSFEVYKLKSGETATVKVEYLVDDSSTYIEQELEKIGLENLSKENQEILEEINNAIENNDTKVAIEKIKELENAIEKEEEDLYKLELKFEPVLASLNEELTEIKEFLGNNLSTEDEFITKIEMRAEELEESINAHSGISEENLTALKEIDQKWLDKESEKFVKRIYNEYNELKSELIELGFAEEIEKNLTDLENKLMEFEVRKELTTVPGILDSLEKLKEYRNQKLLLLEEKTEQDKEEFYRIKERILSYMNIYEMQYTDAKDSEFEKLFKYTPKEINSKINSAEEKLEKDSMTEFGQELDEMETMDSSVAELLGYLENESKRRVREIELIYSAKELGEDERKKVEDAISKLDQMIEEKKYIAVLKGTEALLNGNYEFDGEDDGEFILLAITILLIVIMTVYLLKDKITFWKKKEKQTKTLNRIEEEEQ